MKATGRIATLLIAAACWLVWIVPATASNLSYPASTIPTYTIEPNSGGPGTMVRLKGEMYWGTVEVYMSKDQRDWPINPPSAPLATAHPDANGNWEATIVIPDRWATGEPIAPGRIYIIAPSGVNWAGFDFITVGMPSTGHGNTAAFSLIAALGCFMLLLGITVLTRVRSSR